MSADLQTVIRDALHADDITAEDLRYRELRPGRPRRAPQVFAIAGAMAAVVVLAVTLAITFGHRGDGNAAGGNGSLTGVVGYRWRVVRLTDPFGSLALPASLHAQIGFTRDGYVLGNDTVNALQANYRITAKGYAVRNAITSLVGSAGVPPQGKRTVAAVDAMFSTVPGATPSGVEVAVSVHGDTMTLHRGPFTLALHRTGSQPDVVPQTPSPSPTKPR